MTDRRYTDEEVAAIFERAAKSDASTSPVLHDQSGLTLAALQEIGREAGISPEAISRAASSVQQSGRATSERFLGLTVGVAQTAEFDRPFSDQEWEALVGRLRDNFNAKGRIRQDGGFREWTNGNLQALVEPTTGGFRLRLRTMKGDARTMMIAGSAAVAMSLISAVATGLGNSATQGGVAVLFAAGVAAFGFGALQLAPWVRRRREQFERLVASVASTDARPEARSLGDGAEE